MGKVIDITERLELSGNPYLKIGEEQFEVNADAATMIKLMEKVGDSENMDAKTIMELLDTIFTEDSKKRLDALKLTFSDYSKVFTCAMNLITGEDDEEGEHLENPDSTSLETGI
jgi:hypothetical protein